MGDDAKLTLEFTKSRLMQEEQWSDERELRNPSKVKTEDAALVGNSSEKSVGHMRDRGDNMCFRCNKPGHVPDIAGQKCILTAKIADFATKRLAILLKL
jgi:hypothetical protein